MEALHLVYQHWFLTCIMLGSVAGVVAAFRKK